MNLKINKNLTDILKDNVKYKQAKEKLLEHIKGGDISKSVNKIIIDDGEQHDKGPQTKDGDHQRAGEGVIRLNSIALEAIGGFVTELDNGAFDSFIDSDAFDSMIVQTRYALRETRKLSRKHAEVYPQSAEICSLLLEYFGQFLHVDAFQKKYMTKVGVVQILNENTVDAVLMFAHKWYSSAMRRFARRASVSDDSTDAGVHGSETDLGGGALDLMISTIPAEVHDVLGRVLASSVKGGAGGSASSRPVTLEEFSSVMEQLFEPSRSEGDSFSGLDVAVIQAVLGVGEALRAGTEVETEVGSGGSGPSVVEQLRRAIVSHPLVHDFVHSPHNHSALVEQLLPADVLGVVAQQLGRNRERDLSVEELLADLASLLDSSERFSSLFDVFDSSNSEAVVEAYKSFVQGLQESPKSGNRPSSRKGSKNTPRRRRPGVVTPEDTTAARKADTTSDGKKGEPLFQAL